MMLTFEALREAVSRDGVGVRARIELEPLGGAGDKVFPPTYGVPDNAETQYAIERRVTPVGGNGDVTMSEAVVLDSVASQANRFELALLDAIRGGDLTAPVTSVDFRDIEDLAGFDRISDYEAPHRIFDALLRDSFDGDHLFRQGRTGRAITEASPRDAAAVFHHSPHTLVFGGWDSTGPRGGRGSKYERAITSEVVALGIERGKKTASRIDPAGIELKAGPLYEAPDGSWTLNPDEAVKDKKGDPELFPIGAKKDPGRPSQANHGNVRPSIDDRAGGVTATRIVATVALSLIQLRRLRFPVGIDGSPLPDGNRRTAEEAARTALAALGLAAATLVLEEGFDLRSRCVLVPKKLPTFELVRRGGDVEGFDLTAADALGLATRAVDDAAGRGLSWREGELLLRPTERLAELIRRSRDLAIASPDDAQ